MAQGNNDWMGKTVEGYRIERLLGGGTYSVVYGAVRPSDGQRKVFKVAKAPSQITHPDPSDIMPTQALSFHSGGGIARIKPDTYALLAAQGRKLCAVKDPALVEVEKLVYEKEMCYLCMEFIEGRPLSQLMKGHPLSLTVFGDLARSLDRLSKMPGWGTHGDLKPDNIMVTASGVKILDPGHFGKLHGASGEVDCVVTTPAYYPLLKPDDLWAFGILLWHAALKRHPLYTLIDEQISIEAGEQQADANADTGPAVIASNVGEKLLGFIRSRQNLGQHILDPLLQLRRPREIRPEVSETLEIVMLTGMRLQVLPSGRLELAEGYSGFAEFATALEQLLDKGIEFI